MIFYQPPEEQPDLLQWLLAPDRPSEIVSGPVEPRRRAVDGRDRRLAWRHKRKESDVCGELQPVNFH